MEKIDSTSGRLTGKVAWISGANSGIGAAVAELFACEGAKIIATARRSEPGEAVVRKIRERGGDAVFIPADVAEAGQVRHSIEEGVDRFGRLDIVVNNAGMVEVQPLDEYSVEQWDRVMDVNVKSMFLAFKAAYPYLSRHERSWVVNVGSISSHVGQAGTPVYTTSKHAVLGLTRSIALDYARIGLRCNAVCPGITDTPMLREHLNGTCDPEAGLAARLGRVPMGVILTPTDVAKSILFFSCDDSSGVTGTSLVIDCGYLAAAEWDSSGGTAFANPGGPS
jgi:NAD(P)-dependent dehydrogenase (short-subunit alcohol dehydrogenase family)